MRLLKNFTHIFYPIACLHCGNHLIENEHVICLTCYSTLPYTEFIDWQNNPMEKIFKGRVPIENATSLLFFRKQGITQHLIHLLKYKGHEEIGTFLGNILGNSILHSSRFKSLDGIVIVPLHEKKLKTRGYNQLTLFARELSKTIEIPIFENALKKVQADSTQTHKNRRKRFEKWDEKFVLHDSKKLAQKHILLVDDVITTGATLEACANELLKVKGLKLSLATMATPE
jgi:ComF family protein